MIGLGGVEYVKLAIFYASWLYFPVALLLIWAMATRPAAWRVLAGFILFPLTVLAYARFVEPRLLFTVEHAVALDRCFPAAGEARIAVFSDLHQGLFKNAMPASRVARAVKAAKPDAALIAGDFIYFLHPDRFAKTYAALGEIGAPIYAVLGNHDVGLPGPDLSASLTAALSGIGVRMIDNQSDFLPIENGGIEIIGLSDSWQGRQDMSLLAPPPNGPRIVLTHNPETVFDLPKGAAVDLLVAGHTHGGQIRIPGLTCLLLRSMCRVALYGLVDVAREKEPHLDFNPAAELTKVFVTSGTGMVGLPLRFLVPPRIDVLNIRYAACETEPR